MSLPPSPLLGLCGFVCMCVNLLVGGGTGLQVLLSCCQFYVDLDNEAVQDPSNTKPRCQQNSFSPSGSAMLTM